MAISYVRLNHELKIVHRYF